MRNVITCCVVAAAVGGTARASFVSNFDSYASGQSLHNVDGWKGWDNVAGIAGTVSSTRAFSGTNALQVGPGQTDAVREISGVTSGVWNFTAMQYIASGQSGLTYVILMNRYLDGQNNSSDYWSVQLSFDVGAGTVNDDLRGGSTSLVYDAWVPIQIQINLDADTLSQYYNGTLIATGVWKRGAASVNALQAIDLYNNGGNAAYYDDVVVQLAVSSNVPAPGILATTGLAMLLLVPRRRR